MNNSNNHCSPPVQPPNVANTQEDTTAPTTAAPDGAHPFIRRRELLAITQVGRSTSFALQNKRDKRYDPKYPQGFALFDAPNSPKLFSRADALAWIKSRAQAWQVRGRR